jgi:uncharacterized protein (DUF983 family)
MSRERSLITSILTTKCPRCREGNMFPAGTLYSRRFADMYPACPCCGQVFEPEPGYYYGAMYVSFGFSTGVFLAVLFVLNLLVEEITMAMVMTSVLTIVIGFLPITFRLSRALWINIFIRYQGPCRQLPKPGH